MKKKQLKMMDEVALLWLAYRSGLLEKMLKLAAAADKSDKPIIKSASNAAKKERDKGS